MDLVTSVSVLNSLNLWDGEPGFHIGKSMSAVFKTSAEPRMGMG